ncbi:hypothetical protein [Roseomonas sp. BN140053]|uniref:hypothetical protein n=1 Tax=Roseomonas sp. BN140053 TaxID=3391898 RepID=UPI0039EB8F1B
MPEEAVVPTQPDRTCSIEVGKPGQAYLIGPFGRIGLFRVTDLTWAPQVEEICIRPLNSAPTRRILPLGCGGSLTVIGVVEAEEDGDERHEDPAATVPYDHAAKSHQKKGSFLRTPLRWHPQRKGALAAYSGDVQIAYIWRNEGDVAGRWQWMLDGVHWKWICASRGEVATSAAARRACERAWAKWLARLVSAPPEIGQRPKPVLAGFPKS